VLLLYDTWGDIDVIVESITTLTVLLAASTKLINIVINNHKVSCQIVNVINCQIFYFLYYFFLNLDQFRRLLQLMNKHWEIFNTEFERHILRYYASIGQKITNYFAGTGINSS